MAIAHRATGAALFSQNTMSPVIPAAQATGDMMLLLCGGKPYNGTRTVSTTGWTSLGSFTDGTVAASAADLGSMFVEAWWKVATADPEANPTVTEGATVWDVVGGIVMCFSKDIGDVWSTPAVVGGGDATSGTGFSVTGGSDPGVVAGDHCVSYAAYKSDAATPCSSHLVATQTGVTFSNTHDPSTDPESTTGFDMGMCINRATTTGTSSAAPVMVATLAASHTGSAMFIRLRTTPVTHISVPVGFATGIDY